MSLPCDPQLAIPGSLFSPVMFRLCGGDFVDGLEGTLGHGSYGLLEPEHVEWALAMADKHGCALADQKATGILGT